MLEVIDEAALEPEKVIEAVRVRAELRLVAKMPLADQPGRVPVVLQESRQRIPGRREAGLASRRFRPPESGLEPEPLLVAAGDQRRACRRALWRRIEVGQPHTLACQAVDRRRLHIRRSVAADIPIAD